MMNRLQSISAYIPYIAGYLFTALVGQFFIAIIMGELKTKIRTYLPEIKGFSKAYSWYASMVGYMDGILYITSLLAGRPAFIAAWLAFKLAGRWESVKLDEEERKKIAKDQDWSPAERFITTNAEYNIFTIGNALSVIYAVAGWKIIEWMKADKLDRVWALCAITIIGSVIFYCSAKCQTERLENLFSNVKKKLKESEREDAVEDNKKDYKDKLNNFADWFTAIIISNFAYLVSFGKKDQIEAVLKGEEYLWYWSFWLSFFALIFIFFVKIVGVFAARIRIKKVDEGGDYFQHCMESSRTIFSGFFVGFGLFSIMFTGFILNTKFNLF